jgi:hypothetical protein
MPDKPVLHRRDHEHGGADTVRIQYESVGGAGPGGIMFDTYPQAGQWLYIETDGTDTSPSGYGIEIFDTSGNGIDVGSNGGITLKNITDGDISLNNTSSSGRVLIEASGSDGVDISTSGGPISLSASGDISVTAAGNIIMAGLPFSDPHVLGAIYVDVATDHLVYSGG